RVCECRPMVTLTSHIQFITTHTLCLCLDACTYTLTLRHILTPLTSHHSPSCCALIHRRVHTHTYTPPHTHTNTHTHTHTEVHTYKHTHTHTHKQTHAPLITFCGIPLSSNPCFYP